ncbi:hypothetical protein SpCBS45565_g01240 [Spizellomyces sp. 'palustris']|nr:hypothetical protein SpCBS45565_g01240 [Spizellomyces sp. 'palustris']
MGNANSTNPNSRKPRLSFSSASGQNQQSNNSSPSQSTTSPTSIPNRPAAALVHDSPFVGSPLMVSDNFGQSLAHAPAPRSSLRPLGHQRLPSRNSSLGEEEWAAATMRNPGPHRLSGPSEDDLVAGIGGMDFDSGPSAELNTSAGASLGKGDGPTFIPIPGPSQSYVQPPNERSYRNTSRISHGYGMNRREVEKGNGVIPIMISWAQGGGAVYVTGTFNNWKQKIRMSRSNADFTTVIDMPPGTHRFKFIVDDEWKCSEDLPIASDADGNLVNYLEVTDETGEGQGDGLDGLSKLSDGRLTPPTLSSTPPEAYTSEIPSYLLSHSHSHFHSHHLIPSSSTGPPAPPPTDPPPQLPPHLEKVLLNSHAVSRDDRSILPVPNHVTLNHMYACSIRDGVMAVGCTTRYRMKYITTVLYKPVFQ